MAEEDSLSKAVNWEEYLQRHGNRKGLLMTALELKWHMAPKEQKAALWREVQAERKKAAALPAANQGGTLQGVKQEGTATPKDVKQEDTALDQRAASSTESKPSTQKAALPSQTKEEEHKPLDQRGATANEEKPKPLDQKNATPNGQPKALDQRAPTKPEEKVLGPSQKQKEKDGQKPEVPDWGDGSKSSSSSSSTSSSSSVQEPPSKKMKEEDTLDKRGKSFKWQLKEAPVVLTERPKVAIDWHRTLAFQDHVTEGSIKMLKALKEAGFDVWLVSYSATERAKATERKSNQIWDGWSGQIFTPDRCGRRGKANACWKEGIQTIFDDNWDIIQECKAWKMETYAVVPRYQAQWWEGEVTYPSFSAAAAAFLDKRKRRGG
eukprot:s605_g15.t1